MRIFYAGDIHGSERLWRKFLNAAAFYEADVLVLGGDLTGKILVPLVELR
ncbi:MAG: metallophosphoesterase, partial [Thermoleophilia bacterium]|nr:metallophosphoesterase [Thermoleophilia bacterium]